MSKQKSVVWNKGHTTLLRTILPLFAFIYTVSCKTKPISDMASSLSKPFTRPIEINIVYNVYTHHNMK
jgi:hypothetical protein